jgi:hypothetical protein
MQAEESLSARAAGVDLAALDFPHFIYIYIYTYICS